MDFKQHMQLMERQMKKVEQSAKKAAKTFEPRDFLLEDAADGCSYSVAQSHVYVQSSSNGGKPHVYQESAMARSGPGGLKEVKKVVCDSEKGKQCCVGRALGQKAHLVRREEDQRGVVEEHQDLYNLDEDSEELKQFHREWETRGAASLPEYRPQTYKKLTKK